MVGLLLAFMSLIMVMAKRPYAERSLNSAAVLAQINLFFVLLVALLLKVDLDNQGDPSYYGGLLALLVIVPVALPVLVMVYNQASGSGSEGSRIVKDSSWVEDG